MNKKITIERAAPKGFIINEYDEYLQITKKWLGRKTIVAIITIFSLVFPLVLFLSDSDAIKIKSEIMILAIQILLFLAVLIAIYYAIATLVNKTNIYVSQKAIEIKHQPLPWFGSKRIETSNIKQFFLRSFQDTSSSRGGKGYYVNILTHEHQEIYFLSGFNNRDEALYLEQELEKYLGIENIKVDGEDR